MKIVDCFLDGYNDCTKKLVILEVESVKTNHFVDPQRNCERCLVVQMI